MMDELEQYFQNKENCYHSIATARKAFGDVNTTEEQYDQMQKALGIMYMHCSEEIEGIVMSTIAEAEMRRAYFEDGWKQE